MTDQQTEAAYDFGALPDRLNSDNKLQKMTYLFLTRVYSVFRPEKLPVVGQVRPQAEDLGGGCGSEVLENLLKDRVRGVTKGADTELSWSTELEEAKRSFDEAIGYLDLDYPDAAEKVRQNRRSRPKGVEEKGKGKGESDRDRAGTPAREPATSSGGTNGKGKGTGKGRTQFLTPATPTILTPGTTSRTLAKTCFTQSG